MYRTRLFSLLVFLFACISMCCGVSLFPKSLNTQKGTAADVSVSALQTKDQSGNQDTWGKYVELYGSQEAYQGEFTFDASSVDAAAVSSFALNVNFKGPKKNTQAWTFAFQEAASGNWVEAGDNAGASEWKWSSLSFNGDGAFSSLVKDGEVKLRLSSNNKKDDCDIDFLELELTTSSSSSSTQKPTAAPTAAATQKPTATPTAAPTQKPTEKPTTAPTQKPTAAPTTKPTSAPTTKPTAAPTTKPTSAPTTKPTSAPTAAPTTKPTTTGSTTTPTASAGGRKCPAGSHYRPGPGTTWQWQLSGTVSTSFDVQVYDIDMFDASTTLITTLHNAGRAVVCYIDTAYEPGRPDSSSFTSAVLGSGIDGWPGQKWVDIRSTVVRNIMTNRIAQAAAKGCDAVEMDDVDAYANNPGFPLTAADQISFNSFLATTAHSYDLGIALKNDLEQVSQLASQFDFAVNEQCFEYDECDDLKTFINQGKAVFGVEYDLATSAFCSKANSNNFSWLKKGLDLDAAMTSCCPTCTGTYTCVSSSSARSFDAEQELVNEVLASEEAVEEVARVVEEPAAASSAVKIGFASVVVIAALFVALF